MNQVKKSTAGIIVVVGAGLTFVILGLLCAGGAILYLGSNTLRQAQLEIAEAEEQVARAEAELDDSIAEQNAREKQDAVDRLNRIVYHARVVDVADGEIITVLRDGIMKRIRIAGIDCPENGQPFRNRARQLTIDLCLNKNVMVVVEAQDDESQQTAQIYTTDARKHVGVELLRAGLAWRLKDCDDVDLTDIEREAKKARVGLWSEIDPVPPWTWREN